MDQKIGYYAGGTIVLVLVIFGVLYGWFRIREPLPQAQRAALEAAAFDTLADRAAAEADFSRLWDEHVSLTRDVILSQFNDRPRLDDDVAALLQNQKDIAQAVDRYYPGSYQPIADLLTEHITTAKDILDDLKQFRVVRLPGDINAWYVNADQIGQAFTAVDSDWDMKSRMHEHLRITEREALYEWLGFKGLSASIYEKKIVPQARHMAEMMSSTLGE